MNTQEKCSKYTEKICEISIFSDLYTITPPNYTVMALRYKIEWDPEEVAEGYDLSSIYEGVDDNTTVPVISSVVSTTHPAINITAVVKEVAKQVVGMVANTIGSTPNSATLVPSNVAPSSSSFTPSTISTSVKKVVEHLAGRPNTPLETVCIFCNSYVIYNHTVLYISNNLIQYIFYKFSRPVASHHLFYSCWWWRYWDSGWA